MSNFFFTFYECEHSGDLEDYISDIEKSGGKDVKAEADFEEEEAEVKFQVEDKEEFLEKFKKTESFNYSHLAY